MIFAVGVVRSTPYGQINSRAFELSRRRGRRYRVYTLQRRWSPEELTIQRYDDVDMNGDTSSTSIDINNCLIAQPLFLQWLANQSQFNGNMENRPQVCFEIAADKYLPVLLIYEVMVLLSTT
jgi:hypothetical protein